MATVSPKCSLSELIIRLFDVDGLKFGNFSMRTGEISPVYIDMRVMWSYPDIVKAVCEHLWKLAEGLQYQHICGIPYQGIPIATYLSTSRDIPMLLKRQQMKSYGTGRLIEGHYRDTDVVLVVDDVLMTGGTFLKDIPQLRSEGLEVTDCVVFLDRDQGGADRVSGQLNVKIHSVVTLPQVFEILLQVERVTQSTVDKTLQYLKDNQFHGAAV